MKKMYNTVKVAFVAVALGETIDSYYKDENFRAKLKNAKGFDKCRTVFNNLIDVNKKFFTEVSSVDYNARYNELKSKIETNINEFNEKLEDIKSNINDYNEENIKPTLNDMYTKINEFREKLEDEVVSLNEKYKFEEKLEMVKEKISDIKSKIRK